MRPGFRKGYKYNPNKTALGLYLADQRRKLGLTQLDLAGAIKVPQCHIWSLENNRYKLTLQMWERLCMAGIRIPAELCPPAIAHQVELCLMMIAARSRNDGGMLPPCFPQGSKQDRWPLDACCAHTSQCYIEPCLFRANTELRHPSIAGRPAGGKLEADMVPAMDMFKPTGIAPRGHGGRRRWHNE